MCSFLLYCCIIVGVSTSAVNYAFGRNTEMRKSGCWDCAFGVCDDGQHQVCDAVKNYCICPTELSRAKRELEPPSPLPYPGQGEGCYDCPYVMCTNGRQYCDQQQNRCVCLPGGSILQLQNN